MGWCYAIKTNSRADLFSGLRITAHRNAIENLVITYQLMHETAPLENFQLIKEKIDTSSTVFFTKLYYRIVKSWLGMNMTLIRVHWALNHLLALHKAALCWMSRAFSPSFTMFDMVTDSYTTTVAELEKRKRSKYRSKSTGTIEIWMKDCGITCWIKKYYRYQENAQICLEFMCCLQEFVALREVVSISETWQRGFS